MKKIISFIFIIFLISCSDIVSNYQEQEEILDYEEYLYQGWNAFEAVNLDEVKDGIYIELDKFWVNFDSENKEAHPHSIGELMKSVEKHFGIKCPKKKTFQ